MSYQITLDAGTTHTRAILWKDRKEPLSSSKSEVGVGFTAADGHNGRLKQAVKDCIGRVINEAGVDEAAVECVLAGGMVTSNLGLCEVPHLAAPAGLADFAAGIKTAVLGELCAAPFLFIPGMKNSPQAADCFEAMDMMRGEEAEALALMERLPPNTPCLLALPGSHTKFVSVSGGKLTGCLTTIGGELLSVITKQTVVADTVRRSFATEETYNAEAVILGFRTATEVGLARAAFSARILGVQSGRSSAEMASYLLGAVLAEDVTALKNSQAVEVCEDTNLIIGGKGVLCRGLADVLKADGCFKRVSLFTEELPLSAKGALLVYNQYLTMKSRLV